MNPARWETLETLFGQALDLPPEDRPAFLDEVCADDPALRAELAELLAHHDAAPAYFEQLADAVPPVPLPGASDAGTDADPYSLSGTRLGRYHIHEPLGRGGMGVVYRAEDTRLRRPVALKFLPPLLLHDPDAHQRFTAEAQAASQLDHANICTIHEIGETEHGQVFIAMALYQGETLQAKIRRGPLPLEEALAYARQMAQGLAKAHAAGIIHRDVKPANVMVTEEGVVKLLDFGLAKRGNEQLTQSGATLGTVAYMSPEQTRGRRVDARTDVWALGVVLYEMLAGHRPFEGDYEEALIYAILNEEPAPLRRYVPELPEAVEHVVGLCLEKELALRYPSMEDLLADLEVLEQDPAASGETRVRATEHRRAARQRRLWRLGGGVLVAAVLLGLVALLTPMRRLLPLGGAAGMHLAVLPFTSVSADSADAAVGEALRLTVTNMVTQLKPHTTTPLRLVPASEVQGLLSASEARDRFGVDHVITGTLRRTADGLRLDLALIDAERLDQVNANFVGTADGAEAPLQTDLVAGLAELLSIPLTPPQRRRLTAGGTADARAYSFYLKALPALERADKPESITTAIQLLEFALQEDSLYALAHAGLGRAYLHRFEQTRDTLWVARARASSRRALALDDRLAEAYLTLGQLATKTGAYDEAIRQFDLALALDADNVDVLIDKAIAQQQLERTDEAEATLRQGLEQRPDYHRLYNRLGQLYLDLRRYDDAATQFKEVVALTPDNHWGYNNVGVSYLQQRNYDEARRWFEQSIETTPSFMAYSNLGVIAHRQDNHLAETRFYEQALGLDSTSYVVWGNLALAYAHTPSQRHRARSTYERAIRVARPLYESNPNFAFVRRKLSTYYERAADFYAEDGLLHEAIRRYHESLAIDPDDDRVWRDLARVYARLPDADAARDAYEQALGKTRAALLDAPDDAALLLRLAAYELALGRPDAAREALERALATDPDDADDLADAARLYERLGEREAALRWLGRALEAGADPTAIDADTAFAALRQDPRYPPS